MLGQLGFRDGLLGFAFTASGGKHGKKRLAQGAHVHPRQPLREVERAFLHERPAVDDALHLLELRHAGRGSRRVADGQAGEEARAERRADPAPPGDFHPFGNRVGELALHREIEGQLDVAAQVRAGLQTSPGASARPGPAPPARMVFRSLRSSHTGFLRELSLSTALGW